MRGSHLEFDQVLPLEAQGLAIAELPSHPKLLEAVEIARLQDLALVTDLDDTFVSGCVDQHMKYARQYARRVGYTGPHPTLEDLKVHGTVQRFYEPHMPEITIWAEHLRGSRSFHRGLPPMHPDFPTIFRELSEARLRPALGLTARPEKLAQLSEEIAYEYSQHTLPVVAMPESRPIVETSEWKIENLLELDELLEEAKLIVLFDDSVRTVSLINALKHDRIKAFLYTEDPTYQTEHPRVTWQTAREVLQQHVRRSLTLR